MALAGSSKRFSLRKFFGKSRKTRTVRRKTYSKRSSRSSTGGSGMLVSRHTRSLIPPRFRTKCVYSDVMNVSTGGAGAILWRYFAMNGMYDPDITGSGHQPLGFDQFCGNGSPAFYSQYVVRGCKVVLEGRIRSGSDMDTAQVCGQVIVGGMVAGLTPPTTIADVNEQRQFISVTKSDLETFRITKYFTPAYTFGVPASKVINETDYAGRYNANPSSLANVMVGFVHMDPTVVINIQYTITLVYHCDFYNPNVLSQS